MYFKKAETVSVPQTEEEVMARRLANDSRAAEQAQQRAIRDAAAAQGAAENKRRYDLSLSAAESWGLPFMIVSSTISSRK